MYHVSAQGIDERMINVHYYDTNCFNKSIFVPSAISACNRSFDQMQ